MNGMHIQIPARPSTPDSSRSSSPNPQSDNLYFGYGSNLWQHQMAHHCPSVKYLGIGRLRHWHWQINERGYANIVEAPPAPYSPSTVRWLGPLFGGDDLRDDNDRVYGFVYKLSREDEEKLDSYEDVPNSYTKEWVYVDFWARPVGPDGEKLRGERVDIGKRFKKVRVMVYVDRNHTTDSKPNGSYIYKMNEGLQDAIEEGVPTEYVEDCIRPFIPLVDDQKTLSVAIEDAIKMGVDVRSMVEKTEKSLAETGAKREGEPDYVQCPQTQISQEKLVQYLKQNGMLPDAEGGNIKHPALNIEARRRRTLSVLW